MAIDPNKVDSVNLENVEFAVSHSLQKRPPGIPSSFVDNDNNTYGFYIPDSMLPFAMVAMRPIDGISIRRLKQQIRKAREEYQEIWKNDSDTLNNAIHSDKVYVAAAQHVKQYELAKVAARRHGLFSKKYKYRLSRKKWTELRFWNLINKVQ